MTGVASLQKMVHTDRYMVYGKQYADLKATLKVSIFSGDFQPVLNKLEAIKSASKKETFLLLALHRETTVFLIENQVNDLPRDKQQALLDFVASVEYIKQKDLAAHIIQRDVDIFRNNLASAQNTKITELWLHFLIMLNCADNSNKWLLPFIQLAKTPNTMATAYLPTMPQDHFEEIMRANEDARRQQGGRENQTLYMCPNGHPYIIGNCGRPVATAKCNCCGAAIGGDRYVAAAGNVLAAGRGDRTAKGHILGNAGARSKVPIPERKLSPVSVSLIRLLTHIAMHLGASENAANVAPLIAPPIANNQVAQFLMQHIELDLEIIAKALNRSPEECCLFLHILLANVLTVQQGNFLDSSGM